MEPLLIFCLLIAVGALAVSRIGRGKPERGAKGSSRRQTLPAAVPAAVSTSQAAPEPVLDTVPTPPPAAEPKTPAERRQHVRLGMGETFSITPFAGQPVMAVCHDVSLGGMRFGVVGTTLREGDLVRVTFNVGKETIAAVGRVLRTRNLDPITSDVTLAFVRLDPWAARLIEEALAEKP